MPSDHCFNDTCIITDPFFINQHNNFLGEAAIACYYSERLDILISYYGGSEIMSKILRSIILLCLSFSLHGTQVTIIGCGYVGLTMAAILSHCGHTVKCVEIDTEKIAQLKNKKLYIYEPHMEDLLFSKNNSLRFYSELKQAMDSEIVYICVATPTDAQGNCDCSMLYRVFNQIVSSCNEMDSKIICVKSTVPPATMRELRELAAQAKKNNIHLVYNPEFMREGSAINDIYTNNPIVLAGDSLTALENVEKLYSFAHSNIQVIKTTFEAAELIKYAWNAFSAIRVSFVNELACLCRAYGADVTTVIQGFALSEQLLPTHTIKPGPGYGGSCLPKDTVSLSKIMEKNGFSSSIVHQAIESNKNHKEKIIQNIFDLLGSSDEQKTVAVLGLAFKAGTNDIRYAPALDIIAALVEKGITVQAYDPKAMGAMQVLYPQIQYCDSVYAAVKNADCIILLTEWDELKNLDLAVVAQLCKKKVLVDTRNICNTNMLKQHGFTYLNMGMI